MPNRPTTEVETLRARLEVAEETLAAIRAGTVDALVVDSREGRRVYTLDGADQVYRVLVERIEQGACALTPAGVVLFCNEAMARLLGRPLRSVTGHPLRELMAAESRYQLAAFIAEAQAGRPVRGEFVVESPAEGLVPVEIALSQFVAFGETALAAVLSDLRERRRRQAELEDRVAERTFALEEALARATTAEHVVSEREERLRLATEAAQIGTWSLDVPTGVLSFSDRCRELYGLPPGDPVTLERVLASVHLEDRALARDVVGRALVEGVSMSEFRVVRPDGSVHWLSVHSRTFSSGPGDGTWNVGAVRDVTAEKEHESQVASFQVALEARVLERTAEVSRLADQLRVLAAELSHTEQRERRRLSKILHDHVQQLLVAARMQVELARRSDDPGRQTTLLREAESILQEATAASRSLASELSPPVLHEAGLAGGLAWLAGRFEEQHQFAVQVLAETDAEPAREEIRSLVFECVRELLLNAVKHSGVREARVTLAKAPDDRLEVVVRDEGKGFTPDAVRNRPVGQLTFGLFSIEQRLAYVGGQMVVDAAPGRGTSVRLLAPRGRELSPLLPAPTTPERRTDGGEPGAGTAREGNIRVILADDHQIVRQGLSSLLRLEPGIEVVAEVADGPGAIDAVARLAPDVVLMDVNLGEMSGIEATRIITARHPGVKIIGLSMHSDPEVARAMRAAGAVASLAKSGEVQDVVEAIRAAVRSK